MENRIILDLSLSETWTAGFDHQAWLKLGSWYANAFKTGSYSDFDNDGIYLWSRLYPAAADIRGDSVGKPALWQLVIFRN